VFLVDGIGEVMKIKFRRSYPDHTEVTLETDNVKLDIGYFDEEELSTFLSNLQIVILDELTYNDYKWWIDLIKDEVERADYSLVERK